MNLQLFNIIILYKLRNFIKNFRKNYGKNLTNLKKFTILHDINYFYMDLIN